MFNDDKPFLLVQLIIKQSYGTYRVPCSYTHRNKIFRIFSFKIKILIVAFLMQEDRVLFIYFAGGILLNQAIPRFPSPDLR